MQSENSHTSWLDRPLFNFLPSLKTETVLIVLILLAAIASRFYDVGARVMSHDEVNHVVPSYSLYTGKGYAYDPVTHGPLQFHLIALSFFLFGDSDTSARMPVVLFSIGAIAIALFAYRRYLGRVGALIAGFLFLISPYMLFYGRYARNETFIVVWGAAILFATLRYLETGKTRYLFLFAFISACHFIDKATSFIFSAELLMFLFFVFVERITRRRWVIPSYLRYFVILMLAAILLGAGAFGAAITGKGTAATITPAVPAAPGPVPAATPGPSLALPLLLAAALVVMLIAVYFLVKGVGWSGLRDDRSFDLMILLLVLILPLLGAIPVQLTGGNPLDYSNPAILRDIGFIVPLLLLSVGIGMWWKPSVYLGCMGMFYLIFVVFYTTFFTNGNGLPAGMMGALGYWMSQQAVNRGSQPWYYYFLVQIPIYEYLPALGAILAAIIGLRHRLWMSWPNRPFERAAEAAPAEVEATVSDSPAESPNLMAEAGEGEETGEVVSTPENIKQELPTWLEPGTRPVPVLPLLLFWSASSLLAFSVAGEKMPWLTTHIALPLILASGWGLGYLVESLDWARVRAQKGLLAFMLVVVLLASLGGVLASLMGNTLPFQGKELAQLQVTTTFMVSVIVMVASAVALVRLLINWRAMEVRRAFTLAFFALLAVLTIRTSIRAAFVNYDNAEEFLVYAHAARGPKDALQQIEEISFRTTGGPGINVAYDNDVQYPYWWYLRNYPNKRFFTDSPTRDLRNSPVIAVGAANFSKVEPVVGNDYYKFEYQRLWWPAQDIYFNLTLSRIGEILSNPNLREAIFQIWFNRDYSLYAQVTNNQSLTLETWSPSDRMRLYIRKDVVASIWKYGVAPVAAQPAVDPYAKGKIQLPAGQAIGGAGSDPGTFNAPRGLAFAADGTLYVADSRNNRIQHLAADGKVLNVWGTFADVAKGQAPGGTFYEPWGVAVGKDGSVFVTDTWNNRIQKFTADGKFVKMWGYFGQAEKPEAFWGPRGLAVDASGRLYVTDTGNKRVVIFDADGNFVSQFGSAGLEAGQFDEPVGIGIDKEGRVYVADTWNQRMQVFAPDASGTVFTPLTSWNINGWNGQSLDNKPFVAVNDNQDVFVTDPEGYRVLEFNSQGTFLRTWGDYSTGTDGIGLASGIAIDSEGGVWVSDAGNSRLLRFNPPQP